MSSNERRERLLQILKKSDEPVKGSELSAELQVSRQVVVKDIALLRASGIEILATSSGYIILNPVKDEFKIKCKNHNSDEELYDELPQGEYLCFKTQILNENWNPDILKDYFPNGKIPKLALALEFEDNLHEWQDAWYEVQILL